MRKLVCAAYLPQRCQHDPLAQLLAGGHTESAELPAAVQPYGWYRTTPALPVG